MADGWHEYGFLIFFGFYLFDLDMVLYRDGLSLREQWRIIWNCFVHIRIIVPAVLRLLRIPHSDHEWIRHVGSTFYIACLWLAIWYVFVSIVLCCTMLHLHYFACFTRCFPYFACQGWRPERWRAQRIQRSEVSVSGFPPLRWGAIKNATMCHVVMPEVLTPIRLLNYTIVGWAVVSRQHIMSNLYLCWQLRQMPVE